MKFSKNSTLKYVGKLVIHKITNDGNGRYSTRTSYLRRWFKFVDYARENSINKLKDFEVSIIDEYAQSLSGFSTAYAQNLLSIINVVFREIDKSWDSKSPASILNRHRSNIASTPLCFDIGHIESVTEECINQSNIDLALVANLCFFLGLRRREAALLELQQAKKTLVKSCKIDVRRGTKGGRSHFISREISVSPAIAERLLWLIGQMPSQRCLISEESTYKSFSHHISNHLLPVLKQYGIRNLRDCRAYYACARYKELLAEEPPRNRGSKSAVPALTRKQALLTISHELGHNRTSVMCSYVGSEKGKQ